jgi:hypothetical protein
MNTIFNKHSRLVGLVVASALSFGAGIGAASAADYRFETAGCRSGNTFAVRLIDEATGKSVTDAQVFAVHRQWLPGKGAPRFLEQKLALTPDGDGRFTYEGNDVQPGANIRLVAQLDGSDVSGSADVCG